MRSNEDRLKRLMRSRIRLLDTNAFYGLMLMYMQFAIEDSCPTAYTNGEKIVFGSDFIDDLSDSEIDFVLMHEILHVVLKHIYRGRELHPYLCNVACDIVVNSNIYYSNCYDEKSITLRKYGTAIHEIDGIEGYTLTMEEAYSMLLNNLPEDIQRSLFDSHSEWGSASSSKETDLWDSRIISVVGSLQNRRGSVPFGVARVYNELVDGSVNWKSLLCDFLTMEATDYSFSPPDHRYSDSEFLLPDLTELEDSIQMNILFMVDTSGSMSDDAIAKAYSEIKGAIEFGNGRLSGWLGFYDAEVYAPVPFDSVEDLLKIRPVGGGGTSVSVVFDELDQLIENMQATPDAIIILTDGYDEFPEESKRRNIPVFWLLTTKDATPPWGVVARI